MSNEIDILLKKLAEETDSFQKAEVLNSLAEKYLIINPKLSNDYAQQALLIAEDSRDEFTYFLSLLNIANYHYYISDYDASIKKCKEIIISVEQSGNSILIEKINKTLALNYYRTGDYDQSLIHHYKCLEINETHKNFSLLATCLNNIGNVYLDLEEYVSSLENFNKAKEYYKLAGNEKGILIAESNIAHAYSNMEKYDEAIKILTHVIEKEKLLGNTRGILNSLNVLGEIYNNIGKCKEAAFYFSEALELNKEHGIKWIGLSSIAGLGSAAKKNKNYDEAIKYFNDAYEIANEIKSKPGIYYVHEQFSEIYEELGEYELALYHYKQYKKVKDEVYNQSKNQRITLLKTRTIEKEKEIERLKNVELKRAHDLVEEKRKDITDSISYASRIQKKLLISLDHFTGFFPNSFILYQPKDIVSGDFIWASKKENFFYVCVADCTGHGVPGAMMSILGNNILSRTISNAAKPLTTSEMLVLLQQELKNSFNASGNEKIMDGMDIAFCRIDAENNILQFSGAINDIWIMSGDDKLKEMPADKRTISASGDEAIFNFSVQQIQLKKGDIIYMFTDGYPDQFGGERKKKFMRRRLKELLISLIGIPVADQKEILEKTLSNWKQDFDQTDDITLVGIQL